MEAIPTQLAARVREAGGTIRTGVEVESVTATDADSSGTERVDRRVTLETDGGPIDADAVVVATDPPTARDLTDVPSIPTDGRGCVTQYYALPAEIDLETGRRLLLNATDRGPNHVVPHSAVAPEYAPDGTTLLSATYLDEQFEGAGSATGSDADRGPDASDAALVERTRRALESWYPDRQFAALEALHTERVPFAQFDQPPGVYDRLPDVRAPAGPVYLAGDYTQWSSIQGAMESGRQAAKAVIDDLSR